MGKWKPLNRRTFLKSSTAAITLPMLEAMMPSVSSAASAFPKRLGVFYFPAGIYNKGWRPSQAGVLTTLPTNLAALEPVKNRVVLMSGVGAFGHGQGSHMTGAPLFLGNDVQAGCGTYRNANKESADVMISNYIRQSIPTHQPLISKSGTGLYDEYACYSHGGNDWVNPAGSMSFTSNSTAASELRSPRAVFDRLFTGFAPGGGTTTVDPLIAFRKAQGKSVLDSVLGQSATLMARLGSTDKILMDQYFTSLREVERNISSAVTDPLPVTNICDPGTRPGTSMAFDLEVKAYIDLAVLAFACDRTRVVSHVFDAETGSNPRQFPWLGVTSPGHHQLSHDAYDKGGDSVVNMNKITAWYAQMLTYMLQKMISYKEGSGDLLSNSAIVYGTGMGDQAGQEHDQTNISLVLAGELGGTITTGRAYQFNQARTPNLWLTLMQKFGMSVSSYSYSNGTLNL